MLSLNKFSRMVALIEYVLILTKIVCHEIYVRESMIRFAGSKPQALIKNIITRSKGSGLGILKYVCMSRARSDVYIFLH